MDFHPCKYNKSSIVLSGPPLNSLEKSLNCEKLPLLMCCLAMAALHPLILLQHIWIPIYFIDGLQPLLFSRLYSSLLFSQPYLGNRIPINPFASIYTKYIMEMANIWRLNRQRNYPHHRLRAFVQPSFSKFQFNNFSGIKTNEFRVSLTFSTLVAVFFICRFIFPQTNEFFGLLNIQYD